MPTTDEHLRLAQQFRTFVEKANPLALPGCQIELAVASCYWSALHYIDALLAFPEVNEHPDMEGKRQAVLRRSDLFKPMIRPQMFLVDRYYDLMYRGRKITTIDYEDEVCETYKEVVEACERILQRTGRLRKADR